jgi:putrescine importer
VTQETPNRPRLRRSLKLKDLLLYGIVIISPASPMTFYGVMSERGRGHVVTAVILALIAALFTGISYGRMARAYPSAGSAFTYVAREIHPALGYITGWGMLMDYVLNTTIATIWAAEQSHILLPALPLGAWKVFFISLFTALNVQSIRSSARINAWMALGQGAVVVVVLIAAAHYVFVHPHSDPIYFTRPFYDPRTFTYGGLLGCTSIAILTYMGFDGISTLSEETENPRRNILLATVLTCVVIGLLSAVEVYAAQLVWPAAEKFPDVDTAYVWVAGRTWQALFPLVGVTLVIAAAGSGIGAQLGSARLLYGMGRSNALPQRFFGVVDPKHYIPRNNVLFIGVVVLIGAFILPYALGAEMLNFGALIAFMGVNAAAFMRYFVRERRKRAWNLLAPLVGFATCLGLWCGLGPPAKVFGALWMLVGIACGMWQTRGFRRPLAFDVPAD